MTLPIQAAFISAKLSLKKREAKTFGQEKLLKYIDGEFTKRWGVTYNDWLTHSDVWDAVDKANPSFELKIDEFLRDIKWRNIELKWDRILYAYYNAKKDRWKLKYVPTWSTFKVNFDTTFRPWFIDPGAVSVGGYGYVFTSKRKQGRHTFLP